MTIRDPKSSLLLSLPGPQARSPQEPNKTPTAGDLLVRAVDIWASHAMGCDLDECTPCVVAINQLRLAYKVWQSSAHKTTTTPADLLPLREALEGLIYLLDGQTEPLHPVSWQVDLARAKAALSHVGGETLGDDEYQPHVFKPFTSEPAEIWCADCEYHRDHQIHASPAISPSLEGRWQAIETAPMRPDSNSDHRVLLWVPNAGVQFGWWFPLSKRWHWSHDDLDYATPTHWQPLPPAPRPSAEPDTQELSQ